MKQRQAATICSRLRLSWRVSAARSRSLAISPFDPGLLSRAANHSVADGLWHRLGEPHRWLQDAITEYIEEEKGHDRWILNDIAACGSDAALVEQGMPHFTAELMVSYAWDSVMRGNPVSFFGMVYVLEDQRQPGNPDGGTDPGPTRTAGTSHELSHLRQPGSGAYRVLPAVDGSVDP